MASIEADFWAELAQIQIESIGWTPLDEGEYLHLSSDESSDTTVIEYLPKHAAGANSLRHQMGVTIFHILTHLSLNVSL